MSTFLDYYNAPPTGQPSLGAPGSSTTAPMHPTNLPNEEQFPRHIILDQNMCNQLLTFARNRLITAPAPTPPLNFNLVHQYVQHSIDRGVVGDETVNIDVSMLLFQYVAEFVASADNLHPDDIQIISCDSDDNKGGVRPNRKIRRTGTDWIIAEHKSVAAYNAHRSQIHNLAGGEGTEIIASSHETGARSIILKLGKHMIDANCRWGILMGGYEFMVFFMNVVNHNNNNYYQMVVSDNHSILTHSEQLQPLPEPCLISVAIALLLDNNPAASYINPPTACIVTEYIGNRQSRPSRNTDGGNQLQRAKRGEPQARTTAGTRAHVHQEMGSSNQHSHMIKAAWPQSKHEYALLSFPNSGLPDRQLALKRISAQKAWDVVLNGNSSGLPATTPEGEITYHTDTVVEEPLCLLAMEKLGSGICGIAYDSLLVSGTSEEPEPCAIKVNEHDFQSFVREVEVYERLQGKTFIPRCYGGFAGMWVSEPLGVLVLELLEKSFKSFNDMTTDQKHQALACLEQLHDEGYHHGDVRASNFGLRNGKVTVLDFTHVEPCDTPRTCGNWEGVYPLD
ncbi:hypothetical protein EMPG_13195 [Blastomyces silverae]|uniref:Protein kinase domain-containing protein n=1 Tax=Blastomyces silverae TaxID=2060906 RepID=A0A0H1BJT7_9EURO|nr:hypothetical protein EMPG_13195 [Blastomyces silverae]